MRNTENLNSLLNELASFGYVSYSELPESDKKLCQKLCGNDEQIHAYIDGMLADIMHDNGIEDHYNNGRSSKIDSVTGETLWR